MQSNADIFHDLLETIHLQEQTIKNQSKTISKLVSKNIELESIIKEALEDNPPCWLSQVTNPRRGFYLYKKGAL